MTLFTLDTNQKKNSDQKKDRNQSPNYRRTFQTYVFVTCFCLVFSTIYEHFGHGVVSDAMVYLFAYPLVLGVLVFGTIALICRQGVNRQGMSSQGMNSRPVQKRGPGRLACDLYHCGVATLTVGSCMLGVLEIYGTTSRYIVVYRYVGVALLFAAVVAQIILSVRRSRNCRNSH